MEPDPPDSPLTWAERRPILLVAMATTGDDALSNALQGIGFSEIEALVYAFLVGREPATGYRISHAIGKATANTYKAIASLVQQGAVQVDEGGNRLIRAVPPDELLAGLERRAREKREAARAALADRSADVADDRVYTLRGRDQVLERARAMLGRAREIVLGDLFPGPLEALAADLAAAAARGVRVVVKVYSPLDVPGVAEVPEADAARALSGWPGQQLSLVADADEHLLALFDAPSRTSTRRSGAAARSSRVSTTTTSPWRSSTPPGRGVDPSWVPTPSSASRSFRAGPQACAASRSSPAAPSLPNPTEKTDDSHDRLRSTFALTSRCRRDAACVAGSRRGASGFARRRRRHRKTRGVARRVGGPRRRPGRHPRWDDPGLGPVGPPRRPGTPRRLAEDGRRPEGDEGHRDAGRRRRLGAERERAAGGDGATTRTTSERRSLARTFGRHFRGEGVVASLAGREERGGVRGR